MQCILSHFYTNYVIDFSHYDGELESLSLYFIKKLRLKEINILKVMELECG